MPYRANFRDDHINDYYYSSPFISRTFWIIATGFVWTFFANIVQSISRWAFAVGSKSAQNNKNTKAPSHSCCNPYCSRFHWKSFDGSNRHVFKLRVSYTIISFSWARGYVIFSAFRRKIKHLLSAIFGTSGDSCDYFSNCQASCIAAMYKTTRC